MSFHAGMPSDRGGGLIDINIDQFKKEIATEYMRLFGNEVNDLTIQIMNVASTAAAIAIKQYHEKHQSEKE